MNEIIYQKTYSEYKAELDSELQRTAEGFVRIGYLLKVARDTNVLAESGYKTVAEFAEAEYNLDKTQVSRFISINDKFSEGGYSDHLLPTYQGFGYAKLTLMLQLPDAINEELSPDYTKAEIQAIKDELDEESKVSDVEIYLEGSNEHADNIENMDERTQLLYQAILQLGEDEPELYTSISEKKCDNLSAVLPEIMAPSGDKMYSIRIKGTGRVMLSISEVSDTVKLINSRTGEKEAYSWSEVAAGWVYAGVLGENYEQTPVECWEQRYERKYPVVAPVQQPEKKEPEKPAPKASTKPAPKQTAKPAPKKESKVVKAPKEWTSIYTKVQQVKVYANDHIGELVEKTQTAGKWKVKFPTYISELTESQFTEYTEPEEEQIPGQTNIEDDFPELMPEPLEKVNDIAEIVDASDIGSGTIIKYTEPEEHMSNRDRCRKALHQYIDSLDDEGMYSLIGDMEIQGEGILTCSACESAYGTENCHMSGECERRFMEWINE